ncbi:similar to Saccharomyces cerevisiae YPR191W QCR2 Subunit 2 of the ubiquinol cytochrome-c reductase complex [Maudiozyma saulgeensis]|uniref:Cytochrome b-c1 complex subunit 2, mitochondrial n=1 Tax=Maudiozyma saulgeensis TaxID=1789683 RepID=A0A1X7RBL5_9SACH|nr:similar to Saccharomyces cerevisiae YPR191W QCR2 Subunit 2 of the ubiquinol cytochrome-c reductase complex [Kazachstania saulgeensis]
MFSQTVKSQLIKQSIRRYTINSLDNVGQTSTLAVKVHAGSRYADKDGLAHLLSRFNFQTTNDKSALRLVRESELLGGKLESTIDREFITLKATFLKENLPYYLNAIANVLYKTSFKPHELVESVAPAAGYDLAVAQQNPIKIAEDALYNATYRTDLGKPLLFDGVEEITLDDIKTYANKVYTQENIEIEGSGINENDLKRLVADSLINTLPKGTSLKVSKEPKSFVGETRIRSQGTSVAAISIPVVKTSIPEYEVLKAYLTSPIYPLSDVIDTVSFDKFNGSHGLFSLYVKGSDATVVAKNIKEIIANLKKGQDISVAKELAQVEFALANEQSILPETQEPLKVETVKNFKLGKFSYVAIGDVSKLPFLDEF